MENALDGRDTSDLRVSFRRAIASCTPPLTLYCNYRPGVYSNLIFGVPLVELGLNEDEVPKVMRMCIDEVEKRGLNIDKIYAGPAQSTQVGFTPRSQSPVSIRDPEVQKVSGTCSADHLQADMHSIQLLRRIESETSFSFTSRDNIHSVAALLKVSYSLDSLRFPKFVCSATSTIFPSLC